VCVGIIRGLIMVKMHVPLLLTIVYILQVYSSSEDQSELSMRLTDQSELSEAPEHNFNCASLCEQVDTGYAGICCGHEFCDCSSGSDLPMTCPEGAVFCDLTGYCVHLNGEECSEAEYCCNQDHTTPATTEDTICASLCDNVDLGYAGICCAAVLITGGINSAAWNTAELYHPSSGTSCSLPGLPDIRDYHTVEKSGLLCGGYDYRDSCLQWSSVTGTWEQSITLAVERRYHVSWTPQSDVTYLMGGDSSEARTTTTLIKPDGSQEPGFSLKYDTYEACSIEDPDTETVVITGGRYTSTTVSVYGLQGWVEDLQPLHTGRYWHACTSYKTAGTQVFLVTGGYDGYDFLDTTEVYDPSVGSWTAGARLPRPMRGLKAAYIAEQVLIFGGYDGNSYNTILQYNIAGDEFTEVDTMLEERSGHAISVVSYSDFSEWCQ